MDTLSSSVSSFKFPGLPSTSREFSLFRTPSTPHQHHHHQLPSHPHLSTASKPNSSISNRATSSAHKNFSTPFFSSSQTLPLQQSSTIHRKAASGYAAALVDMARCNNALETVGRDVRRFAKLLRNEQLRAIMTDPLMEEKEKGQVVKEVAEKGRFHRHLVALLKMLVEKGKLGLLGEMLGEFERIHDELCGTRVVLLSSAAKMEEDQLFRIARKKGVKV